METDDLPHYFACEWRLSEEAFSLAERIIFEKISRSPYLLLYSQQKNTIDYEETHFNFCFRVDRHCFSL